MNDNLSTTVLNVGLANYLATNEVNDTIKRNAKELMVSAANNVNDLIASNEYISSKMSTDMSRINDSLENGFNKLASVFSWEMSNLCWGVEKANKTLEVVLEKIQSPLDNQAKELRKRAENAFAQGWYEDALNDFLASEKINPYDYTIYINIGLIYLNHFNDKVKALEYFRKSAKYSNTKDINDLYYLVYTNLYIAHILELDGNLLEAKSTLESTLKNTGTMKPTWFIAESWYQHSRICAKLNEFNGNSLYYASLIDKYYILKALNDECFKNMHKNIEDYFTMVRQKFIDIIKNNSKVMLKRLDGIKKEAEYLKSHENIISEIRQNNPRANIDMLLSDFRIKSQIYFEMAEVILPKIDNLSYFELWDNVTFNFDKIVKDITDLSYNIMHLIKGQFQLNYNKENEVSRQGDEACKFLAERKANTLTKIIVFISIYIVPIFLVFNDSKRILDRICSFIPIFGFFMGLAALNGFKNILIFLIIIIGIIVAVQLIINLTACDKTDRAAAIQNELDKNLQEVTTIENLIYA